LSNAPRSAAFFLLFVGLAWTIPLQTGRHGATNTNVLHPVTAQFDLRVRRGTLHLSGDTRSARHEQQLRDAAAERYPSHALEITFQPLGLVPDWWDAATLGLIAALPVTVSPAAHLRADSLHITALAHDVEAAGNSLADLRNILPQSIGVSLQLQSAGPRIEAGELCSRVYDDFEHGHIAFFESGTTMLTSAYPVLERIAALADACRDATLSIVGHTDSSGNEEQNLRLSLARAQAVADWLTARGLDADRMNVRGMGSSLPIADNATRIGRGLNRRIEVRLLAGDAAIPASSD
jgi:outer membrane protein OmpA-like peptidoglycan-associated protein